jgi:hypothetical protein
MTDPAQQDGNGKSSLWLAFRVFDEPTAVFRDLAIRPRALVPILCLVVAAAFGAFATPSRVLEEQTRTSLEALEESGRLTAEQVQERVDNASGTAGRLTILGAGVVGGPLVLVVVAWVLMLIFGATSSDPLRFKDELAIVSHAYMISIAGGILTILLLAFAGFDEVRLSLGFLFDEQDSPFLYRFMNQINVFGAWNVYVLALGNQVKTKAKGIGGALTIVGGLWLALKVVGALFGGLIAGMGS